MRRLIVAIAAMLGLVTLAGCRTGDVSAIATPDRPNIVIVLVDDMGWADVGYHGSEIATPNIDALAHRNAVLERANVYPICSPTRAALLSGQNPLRYGIDGPLRNDASLSHDLTLLPQFLRDAGYNTQMVGKWHLGMATPEVAPDGRGFDNFFGMLGGFVDSYNHTYFGGCDLQREGVTERRSGHITDILSGEAIRVLDQAAKDPRPLFLYLAYTAPHTPLQVPPGADDSYSEIGDPNRRVYAQMVTHFDRSLGLVLDRLRHNGMADDTIVIFMSDNGGLEGPGGASNNPLRGGKGQAFEGGVRVPALISWPGKIAPRRVDAAPIFAQDWLPTLLLAAGVDFEARAFDGQDRWRQITGDAAPDPRTNGPVILGTASALAAYEWPYKFIRTTDRNSGEATEYLFDVASDPLEQTSLLELQPTIARRLRESLASIPATAGNANTGPPPEHLFLNPDGTTNFDYRMKETCAPWAVCPRDGDRSALQRVARP